MKNKYNIGLIVETEVNRILTCLEHSEPNFEGLLAVKDGRIDANRFLSWFSYYALSRYPGAEFKRTTVNRCRQRTLQRRRNVQVLKPEVA